MTSDSWKKLLPKTGPKYKEAIRHLRAVGLPDIAAKYSGLQTKIIQHQLHALTGRASGVPVLEQAKTSISPAETPPPVLTHQYMDFDTFQGLEVEAWEPTSEDEAWLQWFFSE